MWIKYTGMSTVSVFPNDVSMNRGLSVAGNITANGATFNDAVNFKNFVTYDSFMISSATNQFAGTTTFSGPINMSGTLIGQNANFAGTSSFGTRATFQGNAQLNKELTVAGNAIVTKNVSITQGNLTIVKDATIGGNTNLNRAKLTGTLEVDGAAQFKNGMTASGDITLTGNLHLPDASIPMSVISGLSTGLSTFSSNVSFNDGINVAGITNLTDKLIVGGDVSLNSGLVVAGDAELNSGLVVVGDASFNGDLNVFGEIRAVYPNNSIPATAIAGLSVITEDLSLNKGLYVAENAIIDGSLRVNGGASVYGATTIFEPKQTTVQITTPTQITPTPPEGLSVIATSFSNMMDSSANFTLDASASTFWVGGASIDSSGNVAVNATTMSITGIVGDVSGEWLQYALNEPLSLVSYQLVIPVDASQNVAKSWYVLGSNDETVWDPLHRVEYMDVSFGTYAESDFQVNDGTYNAENVVFSDYIANAYSYFRIFVQSTSSGPVSIEQLKLTVNIITSEERTDMIETITIGLDTTRVVNDVSFAKTLVVGGAVQLKND